MSRTIEVALEPPWSPERARGTHVVVIDVLRATSSIATALANGAAGVIAVEDAQEALAVAGRLGRDRTLLCGEREGGRIAGFDLGNSPAEYAPDRVAGKTLVMTTTNGTRALRAFGTAASLRTASLNNRMAVARALAAIDGDITIVCAGDRGGFAFDDAIGAGALVDALLRGGLIADPDVPDTARAAALLYHGVAERLAIAIASTDHAAHLAEMGFGSDIMRCAELDILDVVPTLRDGILVANG